MDAAVIKFKASGQQLSVVSTNLFAANTVSYIRAEFELGHNWDGWDSVRAVWATDFAKIATVLDSDGSCTIPWEVLKRTATLYVNLVGSISDGDELTDRLTTYKVKALDVNGCTNVDGDNTQPITPSQFEQFVEVVHNDAEAAADARDEARGYASDAEGYRDEAVGAAADAKDYRDAAKGYADDAEADAEEIRNMSATATTLPEGSSATASYSDGVLSLGIPKGDTGATGATGNGIASAVLNADYTLTLNFTEGTHYTTPPIRGAQGVQGETGNGIDRIELTDTTGAVKTYTIYFTDGSTYDFEVTDGEVTDAVLDEATIVQTNSDNVPYLFRNSGGDVRTGRKEFDTIVGGTVAWNQLVDMGALTKTFESSTTTYYGVVGSANRSFTKTQNHVYLCVAKIERTISTNNGISIRFGDAPSELFVTAENGTPNGFFYNVCKANSSDTKTNISYNNYTYKRGFDAGDSITVEKGQLVDLTAMFGSTIADYIYSLEQANAGAGVAWFRKLFPKPYYAYNAGELKSVSGLVSHDMTGFNQFDKSAVDAGKWLNNENGDVTNANGYALSDYIHILPNTSYYKSKSESIRSLYYDADKNVINAGSWSGITSESTIFTTPANACYVRFTIKNEWVDSFVINIAWDNSRNGEYEPYVKHSYPLDSDLTLRGIPKLDADNRLYYDGDTYESDGSVTRKYGVVDLGTLTFSDNGATTNTQRYAANISGKANGELNFICAGFVTIGTDMAWTIVGRTNNSYIEARVPLGTSLSDFNSFISGKYIVYELATPTTETADPYTNPQIVDPSGTEEYVGSPIPVGHETDYPMTLTDTMPTADGTYTMSVTVQSGKRVVNWT